ncbi:hypothetical protein CC86DRAFT_372020 [Ophiobolus disseminans]|uniref:Uncharacterized protein n=1 Tax=Ophiobolus disseminans TaxID=1469910 RepID=A0A6A6ZSK2_9PLEO|nr:hypothetical protein CC86DRAFT_372020 [Ophiobolus disseminans]
MDQPQDSETGPPTTMHDELEDDELEPDELEPDELEQVRIKQQEKQAAWEKRRQIHQQINKLLDEAEIAKAEIEAKETELNAELDKVGRHRCRDLCALLHATLPRELRDMIYDYLLHPASEVSIKRRSYKDDSGELQFRDDKSHPSRRLWKTREVSAKYPWCRSSYMGKVVAREVVERWYGTRIITIRAKNLDLLPNLLEHDLFYNSIDPKDILHHIRVVVHNPAPASTTDLPGNLRCLESLENTSFKITLTLASYSAVSESGSAVLASFLLLICPTVYRLRDAGFSRIRVESCSPQKDFTPIFDASERALENGLKRFTGERLSVEELSSITLASEGSTVDGAEEV